MAKSKKKKRLKNLSVAEVSIVGKPANGKSFLLAKGEEMQLAEKLQNIMSTPFDTEEKFLELLSKQEGEMSDDAKSALMSSMRMLMAYVEELPDGLMQMIQQALGIEEDVTESASDEATEEAKDTNEDQQTNEQMQKAIGELPSEVKEKIENLFKEKEQAMEKIETIQKQLDEEKQAKIQKQFVEKAGDEWKHLPGINAENLGSIVKKLHDLDGDLAKSFEAILKSADTAIANGGQFDEIGKKVADENANGTAYERIRKQAQSLVDNGNAATIEKAIDVVMQSNPNLYQEYLAGN